MASTIFIPRLSRPVSLCLQRRAASNSSKRNRNKRDRNKPKKKKQRPDFIQHDLKKAEQFALCDAMRYIRAFEVGQSPTSSKYDLSVRLRSPRNGPVVRNRLRLPHPVDTSIRIAVICRPDSRAAAQAARAGACLVGEDNIIDAVKDGRIEFDRCLCHIDSVSKLNKAGLGKILGPRGLMPSVKLGTVVRDVSGSVKAMVGGSEYREKLAVVRLAVGQLGFTPEEMQRNIKTFMDGLKKDLAQMSDRVDKQIHEVVGKNRGTAPSVD
ncbi:MAG: hypothetical protein Q9191_002023 [Dirinaria sp. TL-2023a]